MTPHQIQLVQNSWEQVVPIAKQAAELFYGRLFELNPSYRALFGEDIEEQGKKLTTILTTVIRGLNKLDVLEKAVWQLGRRHHSYGIKQADYSVVAEALLWTLEQGLKSGFTAEVKSAWVEAYTVLATVMQAGASAEYANFNRWKQQQARSSVPHRVD